jgi:hypothetical protein
MTIKERIMALFNKPDKPHPVVIFKKEISLADLEEELEIDDDIEEELKLWDSVQDGFSTEDAPIDLVSLFEETFPGKHAIWRGNETKAFIKYKERIMGE